jgi:hypothetical protein
MAYIMCYTPDGRYLDFTLRCLLRSFYSRPPIGEPVKYTSIGGRLVLRRRCVFAK